MNTEDQLKTWEAARATVYRCLADAFRIPEADPADVLDELQGSLDHLGSDASETAAALRRSYCDLAAPCPLKVDYAGLFVGPFLAPAPPYGSVYLEEKRQLMGDSTIAVRRQYQSQGLDLAPDFKAAPDHICAELEFMHVLICRELEAIQAADSAQLADNIRRQQVFLKHLLGAWIPAFAAKVIDHAGTDYYRHLAALTRIFIAEELERLPDLPVDRTSPLQAPH